MPHALVVEDDADAAETMAMLIASEGFTVASAGSLREARRQIALREPDIVLLDLVLPDGSGMELFHDARALLNTEFVVITGHASIDTSVQALRRGAFDYLVKPIGLKQLKSALGRVSKQGAPGLGAEALNNGLAAEGHFGPLWGGAPSMRQLYARIARVATTLVPVFITGESGTGKELVAKTVHSLSRRSAQPFLGLNCGAISPHLIESELFGHERGSFTGADRQHRGFFELANGGTLLLDEITEMAPELQVKLLRVLETRSFMRVGSTQMQSTDVRIIAATNRDPDEAVRSGKLRVDLLYRLNVFPIHIPPLRERVDDIPLLADHFLAQIARREGRAKRFAPEALSRLAAHPWPGNVRELRNIVYRAYVMTAEDVITDECLPHSQPMAPAAADPLTIRVPLGTPLDEVCRSVTLATFAHLKRNKDKTAAMLGISSKTLYNRLKEYAEPANRSNDAPASRFGVETPAARRAVETANQTPD